MTTRTDIAVELVKERTQKTHGGFNEKSYQNNGVQVSVIDILSEDAANEIGKEKGRYVTVSFGKSDYDDTSIKNTAEAAEKEFKKMFSKKMSVLVVGLGNTALTADAIGPRTTEKIVVTRHLREHETFGDLGLGNVSQITPNVLGKTGIETAEFTKAIVSAVKPDAVVVIDALAAREKNRLCTSIQISNTGIRPGSGVGNHRAALDRQSLGVPVFSIGVPTVIDLSENRDGGLILTPKDIDIAVERCSDVIAGFLNRVFHENSDKDTLSVFLNG